MTKQSNQKINYLDLPTETNKSAQVMFVILGSLGFLVIGMIIIILVAMYHPPIQLVPLQLVILQEKKILFPTHYEYKNDAEKQAVDKALNDLDPIKRVSDSENAVNINPSAQNYVLLGTSYWNEGEKDMARTTFEQALKKDSNNIEANAYYGYLWGLKSGFNDFKKGKGFLDKAIQIDPTDTQSYYFSALLLSEQENYVEAKKMIDIAVALAPDNINYKQIQNELNLIVSRKL